MPKYIVKTLGCKANLYDSQKIESELQKQGWLPSGHDADGTDIELCIVNSCTVTDEADHQSQKLARKLSQEYPRARIVFTGCGAEVAPEQVAEKPWIHHVISNRGKASFAGEVIKALEAPAEESQKLLGATSGYSELLSRHPMDREWPMPDSVFYSPAETLDGESSRTRFFLKIQEGCNSFCTYCIIPYGRGPSRSLRPYPLLNQIQELVKQGVQEIVLTGTNIGDYGVDWGGGRPVLDELIFQILDTTELPRLRVSSLDPTEITDALMKRMEQDPRICPHFHVSLQSPHAQVLRLMKRKYSQEHVIECLHKIAALNPAAGRPFVGMDVITGFPGESDEIFNESRALLEKLPWDRLHVFPYSERDGTPATRLPNSVPMHVRKERSRALNALSTERLTGTYRQALQTALPIDEVLIESSVRGPDGTREWVSGYSPRYLRVLIREKDAQAREKLHNTRLSVRPLDLWVDRAGGDASLIATRE